MCLPDESVESFYMLSMPVKAKDPTRGVNVSPVVYSLSLTRCDKVPHWDNHYIRMENKKYDDIPGHYTVSS